MRLEKESDPELESAVPERSINIEHAEMQELLDLFERVHAVFPKLALSLLEVPISPATSLFCYAPTAEEKKLIQVIVPVNDTEKKFIELVRTF